MLEQFTGYERIELGKLARVHAGATPMRSDESNFGGDINWVRIGDLTSFIVTGSELTLTRCGLDRCAARVFKPGSILISILAQIGKVGVLAVPAATNQAVAGVYDVDRGVYVQYLARFLQLAGAELQKKGRGAGQRNVNLRMLRSVPVIVPPLSLQEQIVSDVDERMQAVDQLRLSHEQLTEEIETLAESYNRQFGDRLQHAELMELGQIAHIRYGKKRPECDGVVPVIGSGGVYARTGEVLVDYPTVIVGRKGSAGRVMYVDEPCWPSDTVFYLDWQMDVVSRYVYHVLMMRELSTAQTTAIPSVTRSQLEMMKVPLPAVDVQSQVVRQADEVKTLMARLKVLRGLCEQELQSLESAVVYSVFERYLDREAG